MPKVTVFIERENITKRMNASSIDEIIKKLSINQEVVLIAINNELVTRNIKLKDNDEIKLLSVISGG